MLSLPPSLTALVAALNRLPGIGPRTAERLALHLVQSDPAEVRQLAEAIVRARERTRSCSQCGALTETQQCARCLDDQRDRTTLCVVEKPVDIFLLEKAGGFHGGFHVLNGKLSPLNGIGPEDLRLAELETRLEREPITEIVLALPTDVEGDATCFYLARRFAARDVKVTRLAHGLPVGSGLEYADELTLSRALEGRQPVG